MLAYGYEPTDDERGTILVYDSNCPGTGQFISFDLRGDALEATESCGRSGNGLRGFFCETYEPRIPPAA